jgi:acetyl-CoA carboxylase biotin carboxyl carrier protein
MKSPLVGTFYASPSPEEEPFVKVGDRVSKGDTLCIVEAMKSMNEIKTEKSGKIIEICQNNADVIEYNQVLFKIEI